MIAEEEEGRLTGSEAELFPPFPISGWIATLPTAAARSPLVSLRAVYISLPTYSIWLGVCLVKKLYNAVTD